MEIRGDPVKTGAGIRWRWTTSGIPFESRQECQGSGLVPTSSGMTLRLRTQTFVRDLSAIHKFSTKPMGFKGDLQFLF